MYLFFGKEEHGWTEAAERRARWSVAVAVVVVILLSLLFDSNKAVPVHELEAPMAYVEAVPFPGTGSDELFLTDIAKDRTWQLTDDIIDVFDARLSPSGSHILFTSKRAYGWAGVPDMMNSADRTHAFTYDLASGTIDAVDLEWAENIVKERLRLREMTWTERLTRTTDAYRQPVHWDDIAWASSDTTRFAVSGSIRHPFWSVGPGGPIWPSVEYVFVADAERETVRLLRTGSDSAYTLMWSPDGRRLLVSSREHVLIDVATGDSLALPEAHDGTAVRPIAWAGPATLLFASSISSWRRLTAYNLNTKRWTPITKLRFGDRFVQFSPADTASAVTDRDLIIRRSLGKHDEFQLVLLRQPQGLEKAIRSSERRRSAY